MPRYEYRKGDQVQERVRTVPRGFEDTRLGLLAADREKAKQVDGWHLVDETKPATPKAKQGDTARG